MVDPVLPCVDRSVLVVELENWMVKTTNGCEDEELTRVPTRLQSARFACLNTSFLTCSLQFEMSWPAVMCMVFYKHYTWCELEAASHRIPLQVVPPLVSTQTCDTQTCDTQTCEALES